MELRVPMNVMERSGESVFRCGLPGTQRARIDSEQLGWPQEKG